MEKIPTGVIPGLIGLLVVLAPGVFLKPTDNPIEDAKKKAWFRRMGYFLLAIGAALFLSGLTSQK